MKFQSLEVPLLRITFHIIQRTSEIIGNLCPNPKNYLSKSLRDILKYLPNIQNCDTTYQLPYLRFMTLFVDSKVSMFFASNHVSQQYHMQPPVVHIPLVYLVPPLVIPLPMSTMLEDISALTMLWFFSIFPLQNPNSTNSA